MARKARGAQSEGGEMVVAVFRAAGAHLRRVSHAAQRLPNQVRLNAKGIVSPLLLSNGKEAYCAPIEFLTFDIERIY